MKAIFSVILSAVLVLIGCATGLVVLPLVLLSVVSVLGLVLLIVAGAAVVVVPLALVGCINVGPSNAVVGSGVAATEQRPVASFSAVDLNGSGRLIIRQGDTESLTVTADDNILPLIESRVQAGTLHLGPQPGSNIRPKTPIVYELTLKNLTSVEINGSGKVEADALRTSSLRLEGNGSSEFTLGQLQASTLKVQINGSGSFTAQGQADRQEVEIHGSGDFKGENLKGQDADINIAGSGQAVVNVTGKLDVEIAGSGQVEYLGDPSNVTADVSGSGKVRKR